MAGIRALCVMGLWTYWLDSYNVDMYLLMTHESWSLHDSNFGTKGEVGLYQNGVLDQQLGSCNLGFPATW